MANNNSCIDTLHARTQSRLATINVFLNPKTNVDDRLDLIQNIFTLDKSTSSIKKKWNKSVERIRHDPDMRELITNLSELSWNCGLFIQFLVRQFSISMSNKLHWRRTHIYVYIYVFLVPCTLIHWRTYPECGCVQKRVQRLQSGCHEFELQTEKSYYLGTMFGKIETSIG